VKAVAVENIDKMIAAGTHFASKQFMAQVPAIPGFDGVGTLPDGTLVGFGNTKPPYGALAEKAVVAESNVVPAPEGIDPAVAAVLASAVTGFCIKSAAGFAPGETVLIQGATGVAADWRSRWPDCSALGGSWLPDATTRRCGRSSRSAQTQ